ncbi:MAG: c-type cytochrome [Acidimicrobiales bacterium]
MRDPLVKSRSSRATRRWRPVAIMAPVVFTVAALTAACGASEPPEIPLTNDGQADPVLVEGAEVYSARCAACHGDDGGGGRGSKLADGRMVEVYPDVADQLEVVNAGRRAMPRFDDKLTPAEIEAVVRYTREVL